MAAYYNEHDASAAEWLRRLTSSGLIADGVVDERSIAEVSPDDVRGFSQVHWFAGIGGWSLSLRLAGWPDSRPVWTGSCPCQPFSPAGKREAQGDDRHLWPEMFRLVRECCPDIVFGEQVESAIGHGWLDGVSADLERENYAVGAVVLGAHSKKSPHRRQRLYWMAESNAKRHDWRQGSAGTRESKQYNEAEAGRVGSGMGDTYGEREDSLSGVSKEHNTERPRGACWSDYDAIECIDGKSRRVESGSFPLAHGFPRKLGSSLSGVRELARIAKRNRIDRIRGYGNAIVPQVAAEFIAAYIDR